jgi:hypothetical protein
MRSTEKGKNFSMANTRKRNSGDFYQTPYSMTQHLLYREKFDECPILEPASGKGAIVNVLEKRGYKVYHYDIMSGFGYDFLQETRRFPYIITNPPFSLSTEFVLRAKKVAIRKFAFLFPLDYLHSKERYDRIFNVTDNYPLVRIYVFVRKPMLSSELSEGGKYKTGMMSYAWFVWEEKSVDTRSFPEIIWIDNNGDVSDKKDRIVTKNKDFVL